jgi:hypothetical protein
VGEGCQKNMHVRICCEDRGSSRATGGPRTTSSDVAGG